MTLTVTSIPIVKLKGAAVRESKGIVQAVIVKMTYSDPSQYTSSSENVTPSDYRSNTLYPIKGEPLFAGAVHSISTFSLITEELGSLGANGTKAQRTSISVE